MCNRIFTNGIELAFLELEPFSKREALNWLVTKANDAVDKKINISIRHIASIWNWRKSKVEWFLKILKEKAIIATDTKQGKTSIILCNLRFSKKGTYDTETVAETTMWTKSRSNELKIPEQDNYRTLIDHSALEQAPHLQEIQLCSNETVIGTKPHSNELKMPEQDSYRTVINLTQTEQVHCFQEIHLINNETVTGQNPDNFEKKKKNEKKEKKEKNQKKEKKEKEEKENSLSSNSDIFSSIDAAKIYSFTTNLAMDQREVEWELAKFTDHLKSSHQKPPKDIQAAFRNWLRRSLEFNKLKTKNEQNIRKIKQTKSAHTSFERFLAGAARALAERQRNRLARRHVREI